MNKPPIPSFIAAYPAPGKTNLAPLLIVVCICVLVGWLVYKDQVNLSKEINSKIDE